MTTHTTNKGGKPIDLPHPSTATLENLLDRFPRPSVESWAISGYRSYYRRATAKGGSASPSPEALLNRNLKKATSDDLRSIRDLAIRISSRLK